MKIFINEKIRITFIIITVILSFGYCFMEYYYFHSIPNAIFIGMLVFATIGIVIWSKSIIKLFSENIEMYINIYMGDSSEKIKSKQKQNYDYIVNETLPNIIGFIYSTIFVIVIYHLDFGENVGQMKLWFSIYLG